MYSALWPLLGTQIALILRLLVTCSRHPWALLLSIRWAMILGSVILNCLVRKVWHLPVRPATRVKLCMF